MTGRNRHPAVTALLATVAGMVVTVVGAGIGPRYLQKTGLSLPSVVGLLLLVAGLALLALAVRTGWAALHGWWRLLLVPAAVVVLQLTVTGAVGVLQAVSPPTSLGPGTPANERLPYQDVTFRTTDGVRLAGWYVPSRNGAAVVLLHGAGSTRTSTLAQAGVLGRAGYGVLLLDARGHGQSGGRGMDLGWYGDRDVAAAVSFLDRQLEVDPARVGLVGLSMGGEEAIGAAAHDRRIAAVVAEGVTGRTAADQAGNAGGGLQGFLNRISFGITDLLTPGPPPITLRAAVADSRARFLVVTAGRVPAEAATAAQLHAAAPARVRVWTVPGAAHTQALATAPDSWRRQVLGFLAGTLGGAER